MTIPARIIGGQLEPNKVKLSIYARKHGDGEYFIDIYPREAAKSVQQNRFFHGPLLDELSRHTGYTKHEVKYYLKRKFGPVVEYPDIETGEIHREPKSIGDYTRAEMDDLIVEAVNWAASMGVHLNPDHHGY